MRYPRKARFAQCKSIWIGSTSRKNQNRLKIIILSSFMPSTIKYSSKNLLYLFWKFSNVQWYIKTSFRVYPTVKSFNYERLRWSLPNFVIVFLVLIDKCFNIYSIDNENRCQSLAMVTVTFNDRLRRCSMTNKQIRIKWDRLRIVTLSLNRFMLQISFL